MSIQSELASMYEQMLRRGASEDIARAVATALCRELVPDNDDVAIREGVSRAIQTVRGIGAQVVRDQHALRPIPFGRKAPIVTQDRARPGVLPAASEDLVRMALAKVVSGDERALHGADQP
jgi:hypothetical protein